jgi:hypothetical protein
VQAARGTLERYIIDGDGLVVALADAVKVQRDHGNEDSDARIP